MSVATDPVTWFRRRGAQHLCFEAAEGHHFIDPRTRSCLICHVPEENVSAEGRLSLDPSQEGWTLTEAGILLYKAVDRLDDKLDDPENFKYHVFLDIEW